MWFSIAGYGHPRRPTTHQCLLVIDPVKPMVWECPLKHQINELWFLRRTLICLFIYIYIHIYTYYTYSYYIYTPVDHVYIYILYIPFFTYIDYVFVRIYLHSGFIGSNVWIVQTSSHLRACTGGHKGTDQAEPSWPRGVPWGWCLTSMLGAMGTMVLIVGTYWILCESTCAMEKIMNTLHVSCCNRLCWLWESQSMHFTSGTWCCCFDHVRSHLF